MASKPGDRLAELVKDAIAVTGARKIDTGPGGLVLWSIPDRVGSWPTHTLIQAAIEQLGKAAWE